MKDKTQPCYILFCMDHLYCPDFVSFSSQRVHCKSLLFPRPCLPSGTATYPDASNASAVQSLCHRDRACWHHQSRSRDACTGTPARTVGCCRWVQCRSCKGARRWSLHEAHVLLPPRLQMSRTRCSNPRALQSIFPRPLTRPYLRPSLQSPCTRHHFMRLSTDSALLRGHSPLEPQRRTVSIYV